MSPIYTWWRSHNVRVRLTLWYAAAMIVVLGVYATGVYMFVSRSVSDTLDQRLRSDFFWVASTVDEGPDGMIMPVPQVDLLLESEQPWVQVWTADGVLLLLSNEEARRRPIPDAQTLAVRTYAQIYTFATDSLTGRVRGAIPPGVCNIVAVDLWPGEGVTWFGRSGKLLLTSEGRESPMQVVDCPMPRSTP